MSEEREPLLRDEDDLINQDLQDNPPQSGRLQNGKFTLLEKVLFSLTITFFISLCILAGLYTRRVYEEHPKDPPPTVPTPPGSNTTAVSMLFMYARIFVKHAFLFSPFVLHLNVS
jgi:hypothetical protein